MQVADVVENAAAGESGRPVKLLEIKGVALYVAMELVTLEREHTEQGGACRHCGNDFPCMHIRWAWKSRELLGWPAPAGCAYASSGAPR